MNKFNQADPKNLGRPLYWDVEDHIKAIEQMIRADEIEIALRMCDQVPAWYRENPLSEIREVKKVLYRQLYDNMEYCHDDEEANCSREFGEEQWSNGYMHPRAEIMAKIVGGFNSASLVPWIFDLGCSHGNLPLGLIKNNYRFTYFGQAMNARILSKVKAWVGAHWKDLPEPNTPKILYCTEVIEHCFDPTSVVHSSYKLGLEFDIIVLSVPNGCLGGGLPDWQTRRLGHVRGWTTKEFYEFATKHWPGYRWTAYNAQSIVLVGQKSGEDLLQAQVS